MVKLNIATRLPCVGGGVEWWWWGVANIRRGTYNGDFWAVGVCVWGGGGVGVGAIINGKN